MRIVPADGQLSIFFPAEKETTNLKFHIHAPFASTVARDSIPHEHLGNGKLLGGVAQLLVESLENIQEQGLLTADFLEVLPNDEDGLNKFYKPLQKTVIQAMSTQLLVPKQGGGHAPANRLLQGPADIQTTITEDRLPFFVEERDMSWTVRVRRSGRADRFLQTLGIETWSWSELRKALDGLFKRNYYGREPRSENLEWLSRQDDVWIQDFYVLLADLIERASYRFRLSPGDWHVVRTEAGQHVCGKNAYFPDGQMAFDTSTLQLQIVSPVLLAGKNEKYTEKVRQFLEKAGVQEIGEREKIKSILDMYYVKDSKPLDQEERLKHMATFVSYIEGDGELSVFEENTYFLFLDSSKNWRVPPSRCYLDAPFCDTGLSALYEVEENQNRQKWSLWDRYREVEGFVSFVKAVGVTDELSVTQLNSVQNNPKVNSLRQDQYLHGARETHLGTNIDYTIENLSQLLGKQSFGVSRLVWTTMCKADAFTLTAKYKPNNSYNLRSASSQLVHILREHVWIPDRAGNFYKPSDISQEMLSPNFPYDNRNGWLTAIGFGEGARQQTEAYRNKQRVLKEAGTPPEVSEMFSGLNEVEAKQKVQEFQEFQRNKKRSAEERSTATSADSSEAESSDVQTLNYTDALKQAFSRPGVSSSEPEYVDAVPSGTSDRRRARIAEEMREDVKKEPRTVERFRQVSRRVWESKNNRARVQLGEAYDGSCQICGDSFQKRDGGRYFEGVYIVSLTKARWIDRWGNLLCLCPKHSAMFEHGSVVADEIQEQVNACNLNSDELPTLKIELCGDEVRIGFATKHMLDLQEMLKIPANE